jgi:hypothetical protein
LISDHLDNDRPFGHDLSAIEAERWHLALGVHLQIVLTVLELLGADIDLGELIGQVASRRAMWGDREQAPGE